MADAAYGGTILASKFVMNPSISAATTCAIVLFAATAFGATPEQKCQGAKNQASGKYAACRHAAEKKLALGDEQDAYEAKLAKCATKFENAWSKQEAKAAKKGVTCPDAPLPEPDLQAAIDAHTAIIATALAGGGLIDCPSELAGCTSDLETCAASLGTCSADHATCSASLGTCETNYASCAGSLTTCSAGTATGADVRAGKTFSSSAGIGATGTMPSNGAMAIVPGTAPQSIPLGYHDGLGSVAGDADLVPGNLKLGVELFGVTGTLGCGNGVIDPGEECDQSDLNGETCVTQGHAAGTLRCGANCALDAIGCFTVRFTDNGDGTVTDALTGLMWEKKADLDGAPVVCSSGAACPDPHDADNQYTYSAGDPLGPPGTAFTVMLAQLNAGGGFAGHTDWRLPTLPELQSLVDYADGGSPVTPASFDAGCTGACSATTCSCTAGVYWTGDLVPSISGNAWIVDFADGSVLTDTRDTDYAARAVRILP